ncbi:MAG: hypothetical protein KDH96_03325 [Candidatus Riesia sp.]|nr:hypothetical protein [Candidatus Riesia sp.]
MSYLQLAGLESFSMAFLYVIISPFVVALDATDFRRLVTKRKFLATLWIVCLSFILISVKTQAFFWSSFRETRTQYSSIDGRKFTVITWEVSEDRYQGGTYHTQTLVIPR